MTYSMANRNVKKSKAIKGKKVGIAETKKEDIIDALKNVQIIHSLFNYCG